MMRSEGSQAGLRVPSSPLLGGLLQDLPPRDRAAILPHLHMTDLSRGRVLTMPDAACRDVWFPVDCLVSLQRTTSTGACAEAATVGRDGVVGMLSALDCRDAVAQAVVQIGGRAGRMPAATFRGLFDEHPALRRACLHYAAELVARMAQIVLCSAYHPIGSRLAGWLVAAQEVTDRVVLPLTQEHLAQILAVQRTTLTQAALALREGGMIGYRRGMIEIHDLRRLKLEACECYAPSARIDAASLSGSRPTARRCQA